MAVVIQVAERSDVPLISNLFQFYHYDFSEMLGGRVGMDGKFSTPSFEPYFEEAWRHPRIIRIDEHPAGFALIHRRSRITQDPETWDMAEFFVMRQYRRKGVGSQAAIRLFEQFRGRWEVREVHANVAATHFWRAVVAHHTNGQFSETTYDDARWRGPVQTFDNTSIT